MDTEQCVIVNFKNVPRDIDAVFNTQDELEKAVEAAGVGEVDGNEIAVDGSDGSYFLYGPDADRLFEVILPLLKMSELCKDAQVVLRYGPADDNTPEKEVRVNEL